MNARTRRSPKRAATSSIYRLKDIEVKGYDLKAVNPNARSQQDRRPPEELLDLIEAKGREVAEAVAALRALRKGGESAGG
jgi:type I restriction enzyme M protein